jgi:cytochrome b involved in lipid metabolism
MPLKPHPTDPDKLVFTAGDYAMPTYFTAEHAMSMTLRDYFAAQVLSGYFANNHKDELEEEKLLFDTSTYRRIADHCYEMADEMLKARQNEIRNP